jgi:hypothetical protein
LSEAAVYTTSVFSEGVYVGAGVAITAAVVVVEGTVVVSAGVEISIVVTGCVMTAVDGGPVMGGEVVVVQPATIPATSRRQTVIIFR